MNTQEVAIKLVQLCRENKNVEAINELYDEYVVSKEPAGSQRELTEGKAAVLAKTQQWYEMVEELHSAEISDPIVSAGYFSCTMDMDVTYKQHGRMAMSEIAVYGVKNGKIISDEFFYNMPS
jgi:hypothetical protein